MLFVILYFIFLAGVWYLSTQLTRKLLLRKDLREIPDDTDWGLDWSLKHYSKPGYTSRWIADAKLPVIKAEIERRKAAGTYTK